MITLEALDRKLLRDFVRLRFQAIAIALVMAGGVAILLMSFGLSKALQETRDTYYERNRFADIFADATRVPTSRLTEIRAIEGIATAEGRNTSMAVLDIADKIETTLGLFISLPEDGEPLLNVPLLKSGGWPDPWSDREVLLSDPFAKANSLRIGDVFEANLNGTKRALTVVGTAVTPEYIYAIGPGSLVPDNEVFGIVWMPERAIAAAYDRTGAFNSLVATVRPGFRVDTVIDEIDTILEPYGGSGAIDRNEQTSHAFIDAEIDQLRTTAFILPPIILGVSVFLVNMVIGRIVNLERSEIGLLKALGYYDTTICFHYIALAGMVAALGVGIGWAAGAWLSYVMSNLYANFFNFPYLIYNVSWNSYIASGLLGFGACAFGAVRASLSAAMLSPAVAMSPTAPTLFRRNVVDRLMSSLSLGQPTMMILRSLIRWPVRASLNALGMGMAVAVLLSSSFFPDAMDEIIDTAFYQSNRQHATLVFADEIPEIAVEEARRLPGVLEAEGQQSHAAILRFGHREKRVGIEARRADTTLSRTIDETGKPVTAPPGGIMLSDRLADFFGVSVGDTIEVEFTSGKRGIYDLIVTSRVTLHLGLGAYVDYETLNTLFQQSPQVTAINVTIDEREAEAFHKAVGDLPELSGTLLMTKSRQGFQETINESIVVITTIYTLLGALITVGVAYNSARIQLSERARELASLRILGFTRAEVSYVLVGETVLIALLAQPLGWALGWGITKFMTNAFSSDLYAIPHVLEPGTFAVASLTVLISAFVSVMIVRRRLDTLDLIAVMKTRE